MKELEMIYSEEESDRNERKVYICAGVCFSVCECVHTHAHDTGACAGR